ncbi:MAG TPA: hypothetical protein VMP67_00060 [Candidatus Limnocylindria bacterium]|nr:hypothetical protein [Candidatus Limnocylindria bacterium]
MLRRTWFDPALDDRHREPLRLAERALQPMQAPLPRQAGRLRRRLGHALMELGRLVAAERRPAGRTQSRRAY